MQNFFKFIFVTLSLGMLLSVNVYANQTANSVSIKSNNQELEQLGDGNLKSIFTGKVVIVYNKDTTINADRVVVTSINGKKVIVATGSNVTVVNQERQFRLVCKELTFDVNANLITATNGSATLQGNNITGNVLVYNTKTGNINATGNSSNQVRTVINNINTSPVSK
ncbi:LptA/OstA family protein [Psittacicella gerlachiana]|uniref:Organic solvent tolerance-like N-terminal domain-containing protein n=1 Tax=Psittacicella gerlachiana TaxID=2028574 RepID=A0A3A1Y6N6_9GAMM|nr:LptA/OstA family protein [Psittacicella gerlachiana]RIY33912.1 hypothetical protein CKF59_06000 [Psittacicella gerlachiana]